MTALPQLLTAEQLAVELGKTARWIYRQHEEHGLPAYRLGRALAFSSADVSAWLDRQRVGERAESTIS